MAKAPQVTGAGERCPYGMTIKAVYRGEQGARVGRYVTPETLWSLVVTDTVMSTYLAVSHTQYTVTLHRSRTL